MPLKFSPTKQELRQIKSLGLKIEAAKKWIELLRGKLQQAETNIDVLREHLRQVEENACRDH